jgi:hypothetical protein
MTRHCVPAIIGSCELGNFSVPSLSTDSYLGSCISFRRCTSVKLGGNPLRRGPNVRTGRCACRAGMGSEVQKVSRTIQVTPQFLITLSELRGPWDVAVPKVH